MPIPPERQWQLPEPANIQHSTAQEYSYERLRFAIMVGAVPPGAALTIRAVADALALSPTPVRESLKKLCSEGALYCQSNRRIITPPMSAARHQELISTRVALEQLAVSRSISFATEADLEELTRIDVKMDEAIDQQNYISLVTLNQQFHSYLYKLNPEQVCQPLIESVWLQLGPFNRLAAEKAGQIATEDWHKHLIVALRNSDSEAALKAIEADILDGATYNLNG